MLDQELYDHKLKYMAVMANSAHTYGNLLATLEKWFLSLFEENFFKTIHVSSQIAHKQILTTPQKFIKKAKPMIIFRPRIEFNEETFLGNTMITKRMGGGPINSMSPGTVELQPFFFDPKAQIDIQFSSVRRVMYLDIVLVFNTYLQQINYMNFLLAEFNTRTPFDIDTYLESHLPNSFLSTLSRLAGIPIHDPNDGDSVSKFLSYMNSNSYFSVTYKLAGSTGKEEFYRYYPARIIGELQDIDAQEGDSTGQIMTSFRIPLTFRFEFWTPNITYLFSPKLTQTITNHVENPGDSTLIPVFADVFNLDDLNLAPGWSMYSHASYTLDKPNDSVDFSPILQNSIREAIDYHIKNSIPLINLIDIKVRKQGRLLEEGYDYVIDYVNKVVHFNNKDYGFYTYTIVIAIDQLYINELIKDVFHLE